MTQNKVLFHVFIGFSLLILSASCTRERPAPAGKPSAEEAHLTSPKASIAKEILNNGLTVILSENHSHPVATIRVTVNAGLSSEGEFSGSGISHFVEHMVFKGTAKRKPGRIEEEVKSFGGTINASTGLDSAAYHITIPKEYTGEALELMEDVIFNPLFDAEELEKERDVMLKEMRLNRDDPMRRLFVQLWQTSYLEHPYRMPIIGHEGLFKGLTRNDLVRYHGLRYAPQNIVLAVTGDIESKEILSQIKSSFGRRERKRTSFAVTPLEPEQNSLRELKGFATINLAYFAMGYHTVALQSNDLYALDTLGIILGSWDGSRLNKKLVKEEELLYTVNSANYTPKYPGIFIIYGIGDYKKIEKAKERILEEVKKIAAGTIDESELNAAKNMVISNYINSLETTSGIASALSQSEFLAGDPTFFEKYVENVKKVGTEEIKRAAKKYLRKNNLTISYLCPQTEPPYQPRRLVNGAKKQKTIYQPTRLVRGLVTLSNGMRVILKEERRLPKVSLVCAFLGGVRVENEGNNGISNMTAAMLLKGTRSRKESEIKPFMESRGGGISYFSGRNAFGISMDFLSQGAEEALDILADVIKNPVFPEEELKKVKEKLYAGIKSEDDDIYSAGFLKLKKTLFENHPYGLRTLGEINSLKNIRKKDIENFHEKYCVAGNMVISIVGDFEAEKMQGEIEKRFGALKKRSIDMKRGGPLPLGGIKEENFSMPREQSLVLAGFRGATLKKRDRYRLALLNSILSGENGRLYQSIRNESGLSYALGAFSAPGIDTGSIVLYVGTDAEHEEMTKTILLKELKNIAVGGISEKEVRLAKSSLIGKAAISLQSTQALAYKMALDELYGTGYDTYRNYPKLISDITKDGILKAAEKYIDLNNFTLITVSGEERVTK